MFTYCLPVQVPNLQQAAVRGAAPLEGSVWQQLTGVICNMFYRSQIKAKLVLGLQKGILSWQRPPTGVHSALLSWFPELPGFDGISDAASRRCPSQEPC